jgi:hypothetical protein
VAKAKAAAIPPADPTALEPAIPEVRATAADVRAFNAAKTTLRKAFEAGRVQVKIGPQERPSSAPSPNSSGRASTRTAAAPCSTGDYNYNYNGHKSAAVHKYNFFGIGSSYWPTFEQEINEAYNAWQYTYNVCGFTAVGGVTAAMTGYTTDTSTPDGGATFTYNATDVIDAGPLSAGGCAGALACMTRWTNDPARRASGRISNAYPWCSGWCTGYWDIRAVMTHEAGHDFGFGHSIDPYETMYASIAAGDAHTRYLWYGVYHGLYDVTACGC